MVSGDGADKYDSGEHLLRVDELKLQVVPFRFFKKRDGLGPPALALSPTRWLSTIVQIANERYLESEVAITHPHVVTRVGTLQRML
jgi:hypothetical protein